MDPLLIPVWQAWVSGLAQLRNITVPCCYVPACAGKDSTAELHIFCDASEKV